MTPQRGLDSQKLHKYYNEKHGNNDNLWKWPVAWVKRENEWNHEDFDSYLALEMIKWNEFPVFSIYVIKN